MHAIDQAEQSRTTPAEALERLREGNARFRSGQTTERDLMQQVAETTGGQWPLAVVLSCIDSRTSSELIFDQGIGDLFNARIAGNFQNEDILGSMEFACKVAGAKLVLVLGHSHCGAIKGACDGVELGNLTAMLKKLRPAVDAVATPTEQSERTSANGEFVEAVARENVRATVEAIAARSDVLRELRDEGAIAIVGGMYDITTGAVEFF